MQLLLLVVHMHNKCDAYAQHVWCRHMLAVGCFSSRVHTGSCVVLCCLMRADLAAVLLLLLLQLQGSKVCVSIAYPADINTPGYAKEALNKVRLMLCWAV